MVDIMKRRLTIRATNEVTSTIEALLKAYPNDYKTPSDVIRSAVFTLERWKQKKKQEEIIKKAFKGAMNK